MDEFIQQVAQAPLHADFESNAKQYLVVLKVDAKSTVLKAGESTPPITA